MSLISDLKDLSDRGRPEINVIPDDVFHARARCVFEEISAIMQKSLGPCGAPTVISQMPNYHITKDGHTISKNIMFENRAGYVDQVIAYMIFDICDRLNWTVGDGTTSAVVATNKIYKSIMEQEESLRRLFFRPRDLMNVMNQMKDLITEKLLTCETTHIRNLPPEELGREIRRVVSISSNGDALLTEMIGALYDELQYPAIRVVESPDGIMRAKIIAGYNFKANLTDRLYINNSDGSMDANNVAIVITDHKVKMETFECAIVPAWTQIKQGGGKLLVLAPSYDEIAIQNVGRMVNAEFKTTGNPTLIMATYSGVKDYDKKAVADLAMLVGTEIFTLADEHALIGIGQDYKDEEDAKAKKTRLFNEFVAKIGYAGTVSMRMEGAVFSDLRINENMYKKYVADAEKELEDLRNKYSNTGAFSFELDQAQDRLNALRLKSGVIEYGANTDFSLKFVKDVVDDAVKAAASAYFNGIVVGKHISLIRAIRGVMEDLGDSITPQQEFTLCCIMDGFLAVNSAIMENAFKNKPVNECSATWIGGDPDYDSPGTLHVTIDEDTETCIKFDGVDGIKIVNGKLTAGSDISLYECIQKYETETGKALDLSKIIPVKRAIFYKNKRSHEIDALDIEFSRDVINSAATDKEILVAAVELVSLLITGNQMVLARPNT